VLSKEAKKEVAYWRNRENDSKNAANISYEIREHNNDLQYLNMDDLSNLVDKTKNPTREASLARSAKDYKPVRDAVGHTAILTDLAKKDLNVVFNNIQARLQQLLSTKE
jgi:hypothetical protein